MFYPSRIPDPQVKKAPDPGSRSVTLQQRRSEKEKNTGDFTVGHGRSRKNEMCKKEEPDEDPKRDGHSVGQKKRNRKRNFRKEREK
jgi:hypothetical protein